MTIGTESSGPGRHIHTGPRTGARNQSAVSNKSIMSCSSNVPTLGFGTPQRIPGVGMAGEAKAYLDEFAEHAQADELIVASHAENTESWLKSYACSPTCGTPRLCSAEGFEPVTDHSVWTIKVSRLYADNKERELWVRPKSSLIWSPGVPRAF
jgi:hypothetical protein